MITVTAIVFENGSFFKMLTLHTEISVFQISPGLRRQSNSSLFVTDYCVAVGLTVRGK